MTFVVLEQGVFWNTLDKKIIPFSLLIIGGWLMVAFLSQIFGENFTTINISRMTGSYHWLMAVILVAGYLYLIIREWNKEGLWKRVLYLLMVGVVVQLSWESVLLVSGIRPLGLNPILFNSLLETNLGMPYLFLIHRMIATGTAKENSSEGNTGIYRHIKKKNR